MARFLALRTKCVLSQDAFASSSFARELFHSAFTSRCFKPRRSSARQKTWPNHCRQQTNLTKHADNHGASQTKFSLLTRFCSPIYSWQQSKNEISMIKPLHLGKSRLKQLGALIDICSAGNHTVHSTTNFEPFYVFTCTHFAALENSDKIYNK